MAADALSFSYRDGSATVIGRLVSQGTVSRAAANALGLLTPALTARQVADRLGYDLYNEFEEKLNDYMAQQLDACYLFGLGLRRELAAGLMLEE